MKVLVLIVTFFHLSSFASTPALDSNVWQRAIFSSNASEDIFPRDQVNRKLAQKWHKFYSGKGKASLKAQLAQAEAVRPLVQEILKNEGVPEDLYYLGIIESGFKMRAASHAGAKGPWQFVEGTARKYQLRIDSSVDERFSLYKSTVAAASYLKDLHNVFNSWVLAAAAYNAGEYRILSAIQKGNTRDYKKLSALRLLPEETKNYVAKIWVVRAIDSQKRWKRKLNLKAAGLNFRKPVVLNSNKSLKELQTFLGVSKKVLRQFNPDILGSKIIASKSVPFTLYVPRYTQSGAIQVLNVKEPKALLKLGLTNLEKGDQVRIHKNQKGYSLKVLRTGEKIIISEKEIKKL